ncbi:MAG TPA: TSUP family transporter [Gemmatimonadaceae bacterium]|nr:TSUP family transporter [Gemmatimonadaceae bacterium]
MTLWFLAAVTVVAVLSGATAAVVGFGIGSLLTPLLALRVGMPMAIAAIAVPHAAATAFRFWRLRAAVDWSVVRGFGVLSAIGGLAGALLYTRLGGRALTLALAGLLILTGISGLTGIMTRWNPSRVAGLLGAVSGFFGGLAGNQGGVRSAALLSFRLPPTAFVATATATGLLVDLARTPVYLWRAGAEMVGLWVPIALATAGVLGGTLLGERVLVGMPPERFRKAVSVAILGLGALLLVRAW